MMLNLNGAFVFCIIFCLVFECGAGKYPNGVGVPLVTKLKAPLVADIDISELARQIEDLIREEVRSAVSGLNVSNSLNLKENPAFFATMQQHPFTLHGINDVVKFDEVKVNIGGGYNPQTGYFVCPKSGIYHFSAMILGNHGHVVHYQMNKNDSPYVLGYSKRGSADSSTLSAIVKLNKGDRMFIKHRFRNSEEQIFGQGHSSFSGFYLHK